MKVKLAATLICLVGAGLVFLIHAGSLEPPGPPAPTMRTLDEVESRIPVGTATTPGDSGTVYVIDAPGSYYLTGDVVGEPGKIGIVISASNVTLDLNGFTVRGVEGARDGIFLGQPAKGAQFIFDNVVIKNGNVSDWPWEGLNLGNFAKPAIFTSMRGGRIERVNASNNGRSGILLDAAIATTVIDSSVNANGGSGIRAEFTTSLSVIRCSADGNEVGIAANGVVESSVATNNASWGFTVGGVIRGSRASGNGAGIQVGRGVVENCSVVSGNVGIQSFSSLVQNNSIISAVTPIDATDSTVSNNHVGN